MKKRKLNPEEYNFEVRYGIAIMDAGGLATIPHVFLAHYADLGLDDAMAMLLIHIMKFKWTADNPYPARDRLPMSNTTNTRRQHTRALRNRGLLFTRRRYYTTANAPDPSLAGRQTSMVYDLETLFHNCLRMSAWVEAGRAPEAFQIEIPFRLVYEAATGYLHDVPDDILVLCTRHLGVSEDAVQTLCALRKLQDDQPAGVTAARLAERSGLAPARAQVAIEHLHEAHLITTTESDMVQLLDTEDQFAGRPGLLLPRTDIPDGADQQREQTSSTGGKTTGMPTGGKTTGISTGGKTTGISTGGKTTGRPTGGKTTGRPTGGKTTGRPTGAKHTGAKHTGMFSTPLEEEELIKEEERGRKEESFSSSLLQTVLSAHGVREPALSQLVQSGLSPAVAQAWFWAAALSDMAPDRQAGYVIQRLRQGDAPPADMLALAQTWLALDDAARLALPSVATQSGSGLLDAVQIQAYQRLVEAGLLPGSQVASEPTYAPELAGPNGVWPAALGQLRLQIAPADFEAWIQG
ncbi:MAG: hypothetical protein KJ734_15225, partial [Chloroflexi bacterium]|nr:hypothetical protein [Chloroflexota bacterium]